jgi:class 3 adenylate cyclase
VDRVDLPAGVVTFLFTDVVGSTRLMQELGANYRPMLMEYRRAVRRVLPAAVGVEVSVEGDGCFSVFTDATAALLACASAQRAFAGDGWPPTVARPNVRMGLHTGFAEPVDGEYMSVEVHSAARVSAAAHGGQVLCSASTARLAAPPIELRLADIGSRRLRGFTEQDRLFELIAPGLESATRAIACASTSHNTPFGVLTRTASAVA